MKNSLKLLTLLAIAPIVASCKGFEYPTFGQLKDGEKYKIGILLPVEHDALNSAAEGFKSGLQKAGWTEGKNIEIIRKNAQGNAEDMMIMAKGLVNDCILTLGVATDPAKDLKSAQKIRGSKNPILFTAVTDPIDAKLVENTNKPEGYVTGTSDAQPVDEQIALIKEAIPSADKVGIFYTQSETNSVASAKLAKAAIEKAGMTAVIKTCSDSNDIDAAITALAATEGIDCIYIPTDNNCAANMKVIAEKTKSSKALLLCGEPGMVANGGHLTFSFSYEELGEKTGAMAAKILSGEKKPEDLAVEYMTGSNCSNYMNSTALAAAGITIPEDLARTCHNVETK